MANLEQIDLSISGMTCSSCVGTIERSLNKVPGAKATVNLATESAHVLVPAGTSPKILIAAVKNAGYAAKLRVDANESFSNSRRMGWRVFLSVLLTIPVIAISMFHGLHEEIDNLIIKYLNEFGLPLPLYSPSGWAAIALTAPVVLIIAWPIHRAALRNFFHPTMDNLISLGSITAFGWSIYANSTGAGEIYTEVGASVVTLIIFGRYLESLAKRRAGSALSKLLSLNPKEVIILRGSEEVTAPIENLMVGDLCIVRASERFPTDGLVIEGSSSVDNSLLTGESIAIEVSPGSKVIAGAINLTGRLIIEAKRVGADTELARITKMVLTAQSEKAPIQRLADRISNYFVPLVILLSAGTLASWLYLDNSVSKSISAAVAVLIIACPCALGLATPVALLVATGRGANQGVVLRRASVLEQAPKVDLAILDKTGTLTSGEMQLLKKVIQIPGKLGMTEEIALSAIFSVVRESNHPVAKSITRSLLAISQSNGYQITKLPIADYQED
ncbi:MAG: heavy metal translocating P-type ATPase, partial [Actinomycetales bacterium]